MTFVAQQYNDLRSPNLGQTRPTLHNQNHETSNRPLGNRQSDHGRAEATDQSPDERLRGSKVT